MSRWRAIVGKLLKAVLPVVTAALCAGGAYWLIVSKPEMARRDVPPDIPTVEVVQVDAKPVNFVVHSQGQVMPRTSTTLVAQVAGRVVSVSDAVKNTGFFRKGDILVKIDSRDYEIQLRRWKAMLAAASARLQEASRELERAEVLHERNVVSESSFDTSKATRDVATSEVSRLQAEIDGASNALTDTTVVAPFDGCVQEQKVEVGQYVAIGTPLALCFATDSVEIRLPITDKQFGYLKLALGQTLAADAGPVVQLEAEFAGKKRTWSGRIVRSEPVVDPRSRMVYLVARVDEPYGEVAHRQGQPLAVGMFVEATIDVPTMSGIVALPESCVTSDGRLFLIDADQRLVAESVEVLHRESNRVIVRGRLAAGQRVCATRLADPVPGMTVRVVQQPASAPPTADTRSARVQPVVARTAAKE